jgi:hypothetical protein
VFLGLGKSLLRRLAIRGHQATIDRQGDGADHVRDSLRAIEVDYHDVGALVGKPAGSGASDA